MTSASFLDKKMNLAPPDHLSITPFLMDSLVIRWRIFGSEPGAKNPRLPTRRFIGANAHRYAFAQPYTYPISKGISQYLKPFGKHSGRTNGRRILRHYIGDPLPHFSGNETTVVNAEKAKKNKMTFEEIRQVEKLANDSGLSTASWLVHKTFKVIEASREELIEEFALRSFNSFDDVLSHVNIERLEVYFETLCVGPDMDLVVLILENVLGRFLGLSKKRKGDLIRCFSSDDLDAYASWELPQCKISDQLKGKHPFLFKVYKHKDRLRIELQANFPKFETPTLFDGTCSPYECIEQDMLRLVSIMEDTLSLVWSVTSSEVNADESPTYQEAIRFRIEELLPTKSKHASVEKVIRQLGIDRFLTFKILESFGWGRNDLKQMAHPQFGFLRKKAKGFRQLERVTAQQNERIVGAIFELVPEWLARTGKPVAKASSALIPRFTVATSVPSATNSTDLASGSALVTSESFFVGSGRKLYSPNQSF